MTSTATMKRRIIAAAATFAAVAAIAAPLTTVAAAAGTTDTAAAPFAAKSRAATAAVKAPTATRAQAAATAADYSSIFATQMPSLANAGWSGCSAPITWSVDTRALSETEATEQIANIEAALAQWTTASGLSFQFAGTTALAYDDTAFTLKPADGSAARTRHIYLAFVDDSASDRMGGGTVGLGSPSLVWPTTKEIVNGAAVFRTDHVMKADTAEARSLYMHELGHVLGLAHASDTANIMYPVVTDHVELGAGDTNGVRTMVKPCTQAA